MARRIAGITVNSALFSAIRDGSEFEDDRCFEIAALLEGLVHIKRILDTKIPAVSLAREREMCERIDELHRSGAPWPRWAGYGSRRMEGRLVETRTRVRRTRSPRPNVPYCVRWTGAYWMPCWTIRERREAGYVGLQMCWPPPIPKVGAYIISGERARFGYRIAEVERFRPPRGAKRYTCRLWCERVDPLLIPKGATFHPFRWHARAPRRTA